MAARKTVTTAMVDAAFRATAAELKRPATEAFREGEMVVYPTHGMGRVNRIGPEHFGGHRIAVIQISFAENQMVLRIPVATARRAGLRKLALPEAFAKVMETLEGTPRTSRLIWAKRVQEYEAKINSGEIKALAEVARDLQGGPGAARAGFNQRNLFERAMDRLGGEHAAVFGTDKATAIGHLSHALRHAGDANPAATSLVRSAPQGD